MSEIKIHCKYDKLVDPKSLKDYSKNPNKHGNDQIERLADLYKYQGIRHAIIVDPDREVIAAGHGRKLAAIRAGIKEFPIVYQKFESDEQFYAFVTSDNAVALWAELDLAGINAQLPDLGPDFNVDMLGIKDFKLDLNEENEGQCDPDEVPEDVPTKAKLGDLFILGNHRLLCGDSTDLATVDRLMNGEKADMVFTDPPYDLITEGGGLFQESSAMKKIKKLGIDSFDPNSLNKHAETNIFCCNKPLIKKYIELSEKWDCAFDLAVYHKQNVTPNYGGHLMTDLEYIFIIGKQAPRAGINEDKKLYSKLYSGNKDADNATAWSKPVELCQKFIKLYSSKNVLDYFGGSGSTIIGCEKTNRKCFMMELDPHYIDVIIARWQKFTGKKAIREDGVLWDDIESKDNAQNNIGA